MTLFKNKIDTENGVIYSIDGRREIGKTVNNAGYLQCSIYDIYGNRYKYSHQVIYASYYDFPKHLWGNKQINHKDENHQNNKICNLELITKEENLNYGTRKERVAFASKHNKRPHKPVYQYTLDDKLIKVWDSVSDAVKNGYQQQKISACCRGKNKTHKGCKWSYEPL